MYIQSCIAYLTFYSSLFLLDYVPMRVLSDISITVTEVETQTFQVLSSPNMMVMKLLKNILLLLYLCVYMYVYVGVSVCENTRFHDIGVRSTFKLSYIIAGNGILVLSESGTCHLLKSITFIISNLRSKSMVSIAISFKYFLIAILSYSSCVIGFYLSISSEICRNLHNHHHSPVTVT